MKKIVRVLLLLIILINTIISAEVFAVDQTKYCSEITSKITDASYKYMNDIYIKKYPLLAKEFSFGTEADKAVLQKLANVITKGLKSNKEKSIAISNWVKDNVQYCSYRSDDASYFAIDVFYTRKGNCLGYAQLISQLCRLCGIPAVMCGGSRGDMEKYLTLENRNEDHAWTMAYYDGTWNLFDPLFDIYGETNKKYISKWYFFEDIEGITPYVKGYEKYFHNGRNLYYLNGKFINYVDNVPASQYYKGAAEGGFCVNYAIPFFSKNRYFDKNGTTDGFKYVVNPERKNSMLNDECYSNGWVSYMTENQPEYYAKQNGILAGCTIKSYNNKTYYLPFGQASCIIPGKSSDYTLTNGLLTIKKGQTIYIEPSWVKSELENGRVICWETETPETVKVDKNGNITGIKDGYACINVYSKDNENTDIHYGIVSIELMISSKDREAEYKTNIVEEKCKITGLISKVYTGKEITQNIVVKYNSKELKKDEDYEVIYKNNIQIGKATISIKFKGNYSGKIKKTFKIIPKGTEIKTINKKSKGFKITWKKQPKETTGYQIQYALNDNFSKNKKTITINQNNVKSKTILKLKPNKKYYVRIRTYKKLDGKKYYSSWSNVKNVRTKK